MRRATWCSGRQPGRPPSATAAAACNKHGGQFVATLPNEVAMLAKDVATMAVRLWQRCLSLFVQRCHNHPCGNVGQRSVKM